MSCVHHLPSSWPKGNNQKPLRGRAKFTFFGTWLWVNSTLVPSLAEATCAHSSMMGAMGPGCFLFFASLGPPNISWQISCWKYGHLENTNFRHLENISRSSQHFVMVYKSFFYGNISQKTAESFKPMWSHSENDTSQLAFFLDFGTHGAHRARGTCFGHVTHLWRQLCTVDIKSSESWLFLKTTKNYPKDCTRNTWNNEMWQNPTVFGLSQDPWGVKFFSLEIPQHFGFHTFAHSSKRLCGRWLFTIYPCLCRTHVLWTRTELDRTP